MQLGILKKDPLRVKKEEKYDYPVLTIRAAPSKGLSSKIEFNTAALKVLDRVNGGNVGFGFEKGALFIGKTEEEDGYAINKTTKNILNKPLCEIIWDKCKLSCSVDNELKLVGYEAYEGEESPIVFKLIDVNSNTESEEDPITEINDEFDSQMEALDINGLIHKDPEESSTPDFS